MFTFIILVTIAAFAILIAIGSIGVLGGVGIVLLADVIVCIWIVFKIFGHKSK